MSRLEPYRVRDGAERLRAAGRGPAGLRLAAGDPAARRILGTADRAKRAGSDDAARATRRLLAAGRMSTWSPGTPFARGCGPRSAGRSTSSWACRLRAERSSGRRSGGAPDSYALLTGSASITEPALRVGPGRLHGRSAAGLETAAGLLGTRSPAIRRRSRTSPGSRWTGITRCSAARCGDLTPPRAGRGLADFVVPGLGVRCVSDEPWVTAAETCELALALDAIGDQRRARDLFAEIQFLRDPERRPTGPAGSTSPSGVTTRTSRAATRRRRSSSRPTRCRPRPGGTACSVPWAPTPPRHQIPAPAIAAASSPRPERPPKAPEPVHDHGDVTPRGQGVVATFLVEGECRDERWAARGSHPMRQRSGRAPAGLS